ncbi:hypothetical protein [Halosimplex halobium]|uniref:hypothetical protein n=1 Tax=Halosimplex halobium TaxID=3396618 RepID=UPI003F546CFC
MAVVAVYEDWVPFALGVGKVVLTHGVFGMINPSRVYNHEAAIANPWAWGLIHGVFVLALPAAPMSHWYSTERLREEATERPREAEQKREQVTDLEESGRRSNGRTPRPRRPRNGPRSAGGRSTG